MGVADSDMTEWLNWTELKVRQGKQDLSIPSPTDFLYAIYCQNKSEIYLLWHWRNLRIQKYRWCLQLFLKLALVILKANTFILGMKCWLEKLYWIWSSVYKAGMMSCFFTEEIEPIRCVYFLLCSYSIVPSYIFNFPARFTLYLWTLLHFQSPPRPCLKDAFHLKYSSLHCH